MPEEADARRPVHNRVSVLPILVVILDGMLAKRCVAPVTTEETWGWRIPP